MKTKHLWILLLILALTALWGCGKDNPPAEEPPVETPKPPKGDEPTSPPVVEPPVEEPPVEIPDIPGEIVPPDIYPPIEGVTDAVSLDSIRSLFIGKWRKMVHITWAKEAIYEPASTITEYLPDGMYRLLPVVADTPLVIPFPEGFYRVDTSLLYRSVLDPTFQIQEQTHAYVYRFYEDKLRLEVVSGPVTESMDTPIIWIYKRIE
jgi:hypothetical protein